MDLTWTNVLHLLQWTRASTAVDVDECFSGVSDAERLENSGRETSAVSYPGGGAERQWHDGCLAASGTIVGRLKSVSHTGHKTSRRNSDTFHSVMASFNIAVG